MTGDREACAAQSLDEEVERVLRLGEDEELLATRGEAFVTEDASVSRMSFASMPLLSAARARRTRRSSASTSACSSSIDRRW